MKIELIQSRFQKIARAMSRNYEVQVVPSATHCKTTGEIIMYPFNADYLDGAAQSVLHGLLDRETAHIIEEREHSSRGVTTPIGYCRMAKNNKEKMMFNAFEDIRIEHKYSHIYPGMSENIRSLNDVFADRYNKNGVSADFWKTLGIAIISKAQGYSVGWLPSAFAPYLDAVREEIDDCGDMLDASDSWSLAMRVIAKVDDINNELENAMDGDGGVEGGDQGDADDSANENVPGCVDNDEAQGDDKWRDEGDECGQGCVYGDVDEGDADEGDVDEGDTDEGDVDEGDADEGDSDGDTDEGDGDTDGGEGDGGEGEGYGDSSDLGAWVATNEEIKAVIRASEQDAYSMDIMDEVKSEIHNIAKREAQQNQRYIPNPNALAADTWDTPYVESGMAQRREYDAERNEVASQIKGMKGRLLNVMRSQEAPTVTTGHRSGKLDKKKLARVVVGNVDVYKRTLPGSEVDTAVMILLDLSGSMGSGESSYSKARYAKLTCIGLSETYDALDVPFMIIGFSNDWCNHHRVCLEPGTVRNEAINYVVFKNFDEKFGRVKMRLNKITGHGNNTDGEAVLSAAIRLSQRTESRKILIVISDGMPQGGGVPERLLDEHLKETVKLITSRGIEVAGIGVKTEAVKEFYNEDTGAYNMVIYQLDDMVAGVYRMMRSMIWKNIKRIA
jgi:cobaltochelatase CobT